MMVVQLGRLKECGVSIEVVVQPGKLRECGIGTERSNNDGLTWKVKLVWR